MARAKRKSKKRASGDVHYQSEGSENEPDVEYLTTDPKSPFVDMDLIAQYSSPDFRALLTDQDKIEIAELLPDHIGLTPEGYFNDEFVRYDMDFRHGIRMYQQDLASGRYDPEWLRQAAQAMEQRANGDFDKWKEQEFEEFWGQKQKLDSKARAGQSGAIKLNRLVEAGLFREGDIFSYQRTFGRGKDRLTIEKDVKIIEIDGTTLTCAIPPGQLKFARRLAPPEEEARNPLFGKIVSPPVQNDDATHEGIEDATFAEGVVNGAGSAPSTGTDNTGNSIAEANSSRDDSAEGETGNRTKTGDKAEAIGYSMDPQCDATNNLQGSVSPAPSSQLSAIPSDVDDVILVSITTLQALEDKIISVDGRLNKKVEGNAFKNVRVKRNNQDIGSLFEIREEWYVYKKP